MEKLRSIEWDIRLSRPSTANTEDGNSFASRALSTINTSNTIQSFATGLQKRIHVSRIDINRTREINNKKLESFSKAEKYNCPAAGVCVCVRESERERICNCYVCNCCW